MILSSSQSVAAGVQRKASVQRPCVVPCERVVTPARTSVISQATADLSRRQLLATTSSLALALSAPGLAGAAAAPKGFNVCEDLNDGYKFVYPFGWQEVAVNGTDVVFKDIVEPLESVSVTLTKTDKKDITEFGDIQLVSDTLAKEVLTAPNQDVKVLATNQRELNGRNYYEFEFTVANPRFTRHQLAVVAAANGNFYTLTTGSNEKRWNRVKDRLETTVRSFSLLF